MTSLHIVDLIVRDAKLVVCKSRGLEQKNLEPGLDQGQHEISSILPWITVRVLWIPYGWYLTEATKRSYDPNYSGR
jgi:hypothetical protein